MIRSTVNAFPHFGELAAKIERRSIQALEQAAHAGAQAANQQASGITDFHVTTVDRDFAGYTVGIRAKNPIWRVFDKGSLGNRVARLKRERRKDSWQVTRKGTTYTAHRRSTDTGGVKARNISNPARTAGRRALLAAIQGR